MRNEGNREDDWASRGSKSAAHGGGIDENAGSRKWRIVKAIITCEPALPNDDSYCFSSELTAITYILAYMIVIITHTSDNLGND